VFKEEKAIIKPQPFLRWTGSKKWFVKDKIRNFLPSSYNNYHEPFLGCGAVFFNLLPKGKVFLNDFNKELINTYIQIRSSPEKLIAELKEFENSEAEYYRIRSTKFKTKIEEAAKFIYLNRLSFNGIYRVNSTGEYNVPYGRRKNVDIVTEKNLMMISDLIQNCHFSSHDFYETLQNINKGDLVYLDPPYTVAHENNGFIAYNSKLFSWDDQKRLSKMISMLDKLGAYYILSNAEHPTIRELYKKNSSIHQIQRKSIVGGRLKTRGIFREIIITNIG